MSRSKMDSRELGLVLGQQLLGIDDLHYGLWYDDIERRLGNLPIAQQRYTELLVSALPAAAEGVRLLDVGCGTGHILVQLLARGYHVDGVSPAEGLSRLVRQRLDRLESHDTHLYESTFEALPIDEMAGRYDAVFFSESFQYINLDAALRDTQRLLKPGGRVVICDFFKTAEAAQAGADAKLIGGGHALSTFYAKVAASPYEITRDEEVTRLVSPNIDVLNDYLVNTVKPAGETFWRYLRDNYPKLSWLAGLFLRKKMAKLQAKYFSGRRDGATFERLKSYHLLVLQRPDAG